jgi:type IV pilus assembly protein PilB
VTSAQTRTGCKLVVRIDHGDDARLGLEGLGFEPDAIMDLRSAARAANGLVVVAGASGDERAAIFRALLAEADPIGRSVVTIEQPPGCPVPHAAQLRLDEATGLTPASALAAACSLDADVIAIDAPCDATLVGASVRTALSDRLVFLTVEAPDARGALARLTEAADPFLVAAAAMLVVARLDDGQVDTIVVSEAVREEILHSRADG